MARGKILTYKVNRLGTKAPMRRLCNAYTMPPYQRLIIKRLGVHYSGDTLIIKLSELEFCSLRTALEVLFET